MRVGRILICVYNTKNSLLLLLICVHNTNKDSLLLLLLLLLLTDYR